MENFFPLLVTPLIIYLIIRSRKFSEKERKEHVVKLAREENKLMEKVRSYNEWYRNYVAQNGQPNKVITLKKNDKSGIILINEQNHKIWLLGNDLVFSDIISCSVEEETSIHKGKIIANTKTNNGSLIGRALVGGVIAGSVGAIIGGSTSSSTTEFQQDDDHVIRDYTVIVNINRVY